MADVKISALSAVTDLQDTDILPLVRSTANNKITGANLKSQIIAAATNATQAELDAVAAAAQPVDATLTALAAADWAANSVPVGTGANTLSQTAMAASTILARLASGNVVAATVAEIAALLSPSLPGYQYNRVAITTSATFTATAEASATTLLTSGAVTPGAGVVVRVIVQAPALGNSVGVTTLLNLWRSIDGGAAVDLGRIVQEVGYATGGALSASVCHGEYTDTPGAGSIVYTIRGWVGSASTGTLYCTAPYTPATIRIVRV